jgi:hypothetical protein
MVSNAEALLASARSLTSLRKENTKKQEVGDVDLRIKFSGAPPWLCADAEATGPSESRADVGCCKKNHES